MKDFIISILIIVALYFGLNYYFNKSSNQTNIARDTTYIIDTIKVPIIKNRIITRTHIDTIYRKQIDSIFIHTLNQDSLFQFIASPFDTTISLDTIAILGIKYFPLNRELLTEFKLNPIEVTSKEIIVKENNHKTLEYILLSLTTGVIIGLLIN